MSELTELLHKNPVIALIGAGNNPDKYGYIIYHNLVKKGFKIVPINHNHNIVNGKKSYSNIEEAIADENIDLLVYVIPPESTLQSLQSANNLHMKKVWIQPGAGNSEVYQFLIENSFEFMFNECIMMHTLNIPQKL